MKKLSKKLKKRRWDINSALSDNDPPMLFSVHVSHRFLAIITLKSDFLSSHGTSNSRVFLPITDQHTYLTLCFHCVGNAISVNSLFYIYIAYKSNFTRKFRILKYLCYSLLKHMVASWQNLIIIRHFM